jgi:phenylalanyl-tRNA synthetase beta chain
MRVPLSWLLEYAAVGPEVDPAEAGRRLTAAGLETERVEAAGHDISGVIVGRVTDIEELAGYRKPIRYCTVDTGSGSRQVICGAVNFSAGDLVPFAQPGATLPGGFEIGARRAYGRMSDGMICSAAELAIGDDHSGIMVLPPDAPLGADFVTYAGLRDYVLDINVTPDKGYALSVRGVARELATAFAAAYTDPASLDLPADLDRVSAEVYPASIADPTACDRFVLREVRGIDPAAQTPLAMRVRLARCGLRPVSLAVDVANYLMLELGQPLHTFDRSRLSGPIVVRRARPGERLEGIDHVVRDLDPDDILIADSSGPISMAGTMGGVATEVSETSRDLVIEAAHFSAAGTARGSRRHRLVTEASFRFARGVDRELPLPASARAAVMLAALGCGTVVEGCTHASVPADRPVIRMAAGYPDRVAGMSFGPSAVTRRLEQVGCDVTVSGPDGGELAVYPPSWRPDLSDPADLAEEVIRLEGYERVPIRTPRAAAGRGLTTAQRTRAAIGRSLAASGYVEVLSSPFAAVSDADVLRLRPDDQRRRAVRLANPLSDSEPALRTTLLPGLLRVLVRNLGRGFADVALFEVGVVFLASADGQAVAPVPGVDRRPSADQVASLERALPSQPRHLAVVLAGEREPAGWWGAGRPASWADAVEAARRAIRVAGLVPGVRAASREPWHPGRCAAVYLQVPAPGEPGGPELAGYAGELHPRVVEAFGLPPRTCAAELDLSRIEAAAARRGAPHAPELSAYPAATQDVSLIVPDAVPAAEVEAALLAGAQAARAAGGNVILEDVRLFDVYTGEQVGAGQRSLAYTLRFRAPDRTLTAEEASASRDAAVAEAARRTGAVLRGA